MVEPDKVKTEAIQAPAGTICGSGQFQVFDNLESFSRAVESAGGTSFDMAALLRLNTDFLQDSEHYLLLKVKEFGADKPDNILFLLKDRAIVLSSNCPAAAAIKPFEKILAEPSGIGTVLCLLVLDRIVDNHKKQLEAFLEKIKKLETTFDRMEYRKLSLEQERFSDRLEEFHDLVLELQERRYKQVQTQLISFDYHVLIAESQSLQGRARRRIDSLKRLQQDYEIQASEELNKRILKLNDVVTRLTAVTVIFMVPTLIASHFGMNFQFMPELHVPWAYPVVIVTSIVIFRKVGWL
jgi:hypothetical protein